MISHVSIVSKPDDPSKAPKAPARTNKAQTIFNEEIHEQSTPLYRSTSDRIATNNAARVSLPSFQQCQATAKQKPRKISPHRAQATPRPISRSCGSPHPSDDAPNKQCLKHRPGSPGHRPARTPQGPRRCGEPGSRPHRPTTQDKKSPKRQKSFATGLHAPYHRLNGKAVSQGIPRLAGC